MNAVYASVLFAALQLRAAVRKRSRRVICNYGSQHERYDFFDKSADRNDVETGRAFGCDEGEQSEGTPLHKARFFFFAEIHPRKKHVAAVERRNGQNIKNKQSEIDRRRIRAASVR